MPSRWPVLLSSTIWLFALVPIGQAVPLPASVRACAAETDPGRRLACYDREIAAQSEVGAATASETQAGAARGSGAQSAGSGNEVSNRVGMSNSDDAESTSRVGPTKEASAPPRHLAAHVASVDNTQGDIVVHLDNGQVWEQVQDADTDLNLRAGDPVTIDKSLGDYWLSGRQGGVMKVKQRK
jgi:hypothetical protein